MLRDTSAQRVRVETIDVFLLLFGCLLQRNVYVYIIACVLKKKKERKKGKQQNQNPKHPDNPDPSEQTFLLH